MSCLRTLGHKFIYLAGPIFNCTVGEANDWRANFKARLPEGIHGISPLRCEPLIGERYGLSYDDPRFGTAKAISSKNWYDVQNCDITLAYLSNPNGNTPSYGTIMEIGAALAFNKPVIVVTTDPIMAKHPLTLGKAGWIFDNFDDAYDLVVGLFGDYVHELQES